MMAAAKFLTRLERLDNEVRALQERLNAKLDARRQLLHDMIEDGEVQRQDAAERVAVNQTVRAVNFINTGRMLSDEQIKAIRKAYKAGASQGELARQYGIAQPNIFKIVHRQSYKDVS